jgi:hypothetical protein
VLRGEVASWPPVSALAALCFAGAAAYFAIIAAISRRHLTGARSFARTVLGRDSPKPA